MFSGKKLVIIMLMLAGNIQLSAMKEKYSFWKNLLSGDKQTVIPKGSVISYDDKGTVIQYDEMGELIGFDNMFLGDSAEKYQDLVGKGIKQRSTGSIFVIKDRTFDYQIESKSVVALKCNFNEITTIYRYKKYSPKQLYSANCSLVNKATPLKHELNILGNICEVDTFSKGENFYQADFEECFYSTLTYLKPYNLQKDKFSLFVATDKIPATQKVLVNKERVIFGTFLIGTVGLCAYLLSSSSKKVKDKK